MPAAPALSRAASPMNLLFRRMLRGGVLFLVLAGYASPLAAANAPLATPVPGAVATPTTDPMLARVFPSIVRIEAIRLQPRDGRLTKQWTAGSGVIVSPQG